MFYVVRNHGLNKFYYTRKEERHLFTWTVNRKMAHVFKSKPAASKVINRHGGELEETQ